MDLSVVIPVHNEVDSVRGVIEEVGRVLPESLDFEIIVVDDGSNDDTPSVLQECRAKQPRLRVLRHAQRSGQSATISTGVRAARAHWVVTLDGDGQNDPADIMRLYEMMDSKPGQGYADYRSACLSTRQRSQSGFPHVLRTPCAHGY